MLRRGTAAAAQDIHQAVKLPQAGSHLGRRLIVPSHLIGEAGVGVTDDGKFAKTGNLLHQGQHFLPAQGTVDTKGRQRIMPDGRVEGFQGLSGKGSAAPVAYGDRDHHGKARADALGCIQGGLGRQRIEGGLYQEKVHSSLHQGADL